MFAKYASPNFVHILILFGVTNRSQHSCLLCFCLGPAQAHNVDWTNHSLQRTPFSKQRDVKQYAGVTSDAHYACSLQVGRNAAAAFPLTPHHTEASWIELIKDVVILFYFSVNAVEESILLQIRLNVSPICKVLCKRLIRGKGSTKGQGEMNVIGQTNLVYFLLWLVRKKNKINIRLLASIVTFLSFINNKSLQRCWEKWYTNTNSVLVGQRISNDDDGLCFSNSPVCSYCPPWGKDKKRNI